MTGRLLFPFSINIVRHSHQKNLLLIKYSIKISQRIYLFGEIRISMKHGKICAGTDFPELILLPEF